MYACVSWGGHRSLGAWGGWDGPVKVKDEMWKVVVEFKRHSWVYFYRALL